MSLLIKIKAKKLKNESTQIIRYRKNPNLKGICYGKLSFKEKKRKTRSLIIEHNDYEMCDNYENRYNLMLNR